MITSIYAKGFRCGDFHDEITAPLTLNTGGVGSGKSSRTLALSLLVTGEIPIMGVSRKLQDILASMGTGDSLTVGATIDGTTFERTISATKSGGASQKFAINGSSVQKSPFEMRLHQTGIGIADLPAFVALSAAKQVQVLFELYPPDMDVLQLNKEIAQSQERLNQTVAESKKYRDMASSLNKSRAEMALPNISLPEVQAKIKQTENGLQGVRTERIEHEQKAKAEAAAKEQAEAERKKREDQEKARQHAHAQAAQERTKPASTQQPQKAYGESEAKANLNAVQQKVEQHQMSMFDRNKTANEQAAQHDGKCNCGGSCADQYKDRADKAVAALEKVLSVLERQSCSSKCVAYMVAKSELKKIKAGA